jgi:V8-like Glu-specific endopeptidase
MSYNLDRAEEVLHSTAAGSRDSETWFLQGLLREIDPEAPLGLSPAQLFQDFLRRGHASERMRGNLEIVARPFELPDQPLSAGDVMLRATPGTGDIGHVMVLVSSDLRTAAALAADGIAAESTAPGQYGTVIEAGRFPHNRSQRYARRWLDGRGRVPPNSLILRPRPSSSQGDPYDPYLDFPAGEPAQEPPDDAEALPAPDHSLRDIADSDNLPNETRAAILRDGKTNAYDLTDQAFWARHPDMKGKRLEGTGARHEALREEYRAMKRQVDALIWLRQLIDELDTHRGDIPREFLLGWMAVESDGKVGVVTSRPERGYFQIDWPGGEAREQLGLTDAQFRKLSTDRAFSIEKGVALVEKYRQFILKNFPQVPDRTELLWRLTKGRHAASAALSNAVQGLLKSGTAITWNNVAAQVPAFLRDNVNHTWDYTTRLKPFADLPGSAAPSASHAEAVTEFEEQATPPPTRKRVSDQFAIPFRWMARVSLRRRGSEVSHGSGVLISDVHVLTAAHVVWDATVYRADYSVVVTLAQDGSNYLDDIGVSRIDIAKLYRDGSHGFDYSILTLDRPVANRTYKDLGGARLCYWGSSTCGAGTTAEPVDPARLNGQVAITAGYPRDKGGNQMWVVTGTMSHSVGGAVTIHYTGDLIEGQSGSPAWIEQNGARNIIGIVHSRGTFNRLYPLSWEMVTELNGWMLRAEKKPQRRIESEAETEFEGDQSDFPDGGSAQDSTEDSEAFSAPAWLRGERRRRDGRAPSDTASTAEHDADQMEERIADEAPALPPWLRTERRRRTGSAPAALEAYGEDFTFDPTGAQTDFGPRLRKLWHKMLKDAFEANLGVATTAIKDGLKITTADAAKWVRFFSQASRPASVALSEANVSWRALPSRKGPPSRAVYKYFDEPVGLREQDEYCEWKVFKNSSGKIVRVVFTSEPPEYYHFLYDPSVIDPAASDLVKFSRALLVRLYQERCGTKSITLADLEAGGTYDPGNKWNNDCCVHLQQPNNTLGAQINIAARASVVRSSSGAVITDVKTLIGCDPFGEPDRQSDPRIGDNVNKLARQNRFLTLANPVGLYMSALDTTGWTTPDGTDAQTFWKVLKGKVDKDPHKSMIVRAEFAVPASKRYTVSDIEIGGAPIEFGSQIADQLEMRLGALSGPVDKDPEGRATSAPKPVPC